MVVLGCGRCGWCGRSDGGDEVGREGSKGGMGKVVRGGLGGGWEGCKPPFTFQTYLLVLDIARKS